MLKEIYELWKNCVIIAVGAFLPTIILIVVILYLGALVDQAMFSG